MKIKVVIVGAGLMGRWHAYYAKQLGAEIVAVIDLDVEKARLLSSRTSKSLDGFLFTQPDVDVVHICTPLESHLPLIKTCLDSGINVVCEKPMLLNEPMTREFLCQAKEKNLKLVPVHQMPFQKGFRDLEKMNIGPLVRISYEAFTAGDSLAEILPHPVSLINRLLDRYCIDRSLSIAGFEIATKNEIELHCTETDPLIRISLSKKGRPTKNELIVVGENGTAHVDLFHGFSLYEPGEVSRRSKILKPFVYGSGMLLNASANLLKRSLQRQPAYPGLKELIVAFYDSVQNGNPAPVGEKEILLSASLIDKIYSGTL